MALVPYTITALAESDAQGTDGKNIVAGATCSMYSQPSDSVVTLYDDAAGSNGSTAKATGANGQVVVYVEQGRYRLNVNAADSFVSVSSDVPIDVDTFANLAASSPVQDGQRFICQERLNANYILQTSGYVALSGDVTFANGRVAALQIDSTGMDVKTFGLDYDSAMTDAINRLSGECDIIISEEYTTSGLSFTSVSNVRIKFTDGGKLTLADSADSELLLFTTSTDIVITNPQVDGNRLNQTVVGGGSAIDGIKFEQCGGVRIVSGSIENTAGSGIRGRNCSNMKVDGVEVVDCGYRQIYIAPSTTGGVNSNDVTVSNCNVKWTGISDPSLTAQPAISVTNNGAFTYTNVSVINNFVAQHPDNVVNSIAIEGGGIDNMSITGNRTANGELGISWFDCDTFSVDGNAVETGGNFGIECANRNTNGTISSNAIDGKSTLLDAIAINGAIGICDNISISGNSARNVVSGITAFGQSISVRHKNISMTGNTIFCIGGGKPIDLQWVDGLNISGGILDGNGASSSIVQLTECDQFTITGTSQRNIQTFCVNLFSSVATTISNSFVGSNDFDSVPGNQQLNYVRNSLFAGSTVNSLVVNGNSRGPDFIDYGSNILEWSGTGTPEGSISANISSGFRRTDGGSGTTYYRKESGTGNTGWVAK